ncbi:MAG: gamma-glutamyltransferase, partial [Candidatus Acidiferrum sp.]
MTNKQLVSYSREFKFIGVILMNKPFHLPMRVILRCFRSDSLQSLACGIVGAIVPVLLAGAGPVDQRLLVQSQSRARVMTRMGIVATSQTLASQAGVQVLDRGGNAIDAAIAANAVLGVVEPGANGMGGDLFAIFYEAKTGKLYGLNSSGWAPAKLTVDLLKSKGIEKMPGSGIHSVTVPGAVAGWDALRKRFGTLEFATILAPAIYYAENGYPVTDRIGGGWQLASGLKKHPNSVHTYLPGGRAPHGGEMFRNPDLANSLRLVAAEGRDGYY